MQEGIYPIHARLRQERERLKLSQQDCAQLAGVSLSTWKRWEKEPSMPAAIFERLGESGFNIAEIASGRSVSRRTVPGMDFLVAGEERAGYAQPSDDAATRDKFLEAAAVVNQALTEAKLDASMGLRVVLRDLILWSNLNPTGVRDLAQAIKEEIERRQK